MTARRIATEIVLVASVVTVSVVTGVALGLRALDRWLSTPARPHHPDLWFEDLMRSPPEDLYGPARKLPESDTTVNLHRRPSDGAVEVLVEGES